MTIKIMTFNLRYDKPDWGNQAWPARKQAVATIISQELPDILGTQEGKTHQLLDLCQLLPNYQSVGGDRTGRGYDEHCAIFYNTQRLTCLKQGDFWLSETPEIPGSIAAHWGNSLPRMVSWGVFQMAGGSQKIAIYNTHLDYNSIHARELSSQLICERMSQHYSPDSPLFLLGDFNDEPNSICRQTFLKPLSSDLQLFDVLGGLKLSQQLTFHDFTGQAFAAIDTIYYDTRVRLGAVNVNRLQIEGIWPSDHFPVSAEFEL